MGNRLEVKLVRGCLLIACILTVVACSISWTNGSGGSLKGLSPKLEKIRNQVQELEERSQSFTGFALYDPEEGKMVIRYNADKYFVPASTAKLFTLYTSFLSLSDSIPTLNYIVRGDSLLFWDSCDPSFTYMDITEGVAYEFLKRRPEKLYYIESPYSNKSQVVNWGWDYYVVKLLQEKINRPVKLLKNVPTGNVKVVKGVFADSAYKRMLSLNNNILAEQLLVLSSSTLSDTLSVKRAIDYTLKTHLTDLPDKPVWVDGAGTSSGNMFTPRTVITILQKLLKECPEEKLFALLSFEKKRDLPFMYDVKGSHSNVYNQSGYLVTKRGKVLLYSFMNNNINVPTSQIRSEMASIMTEIHEVY
jgi:hypothetical protein